jgi:integral membrane protein (TIGR01906 family)
MLIALPVFLVTFNVRVLFNAPIVYNTGFARNDIAGTTGLPSSEIERVGDEIREYFNNDEEYMSIFLNARPLFTAREVEHMRDVKLLLLLVYTVTYVTGVAVALYAAWGFRREGLRFLRRVSMAGVVSGVGLVAVGVVLALGFPVFFTLFHRISFNNDYWILNPSEHFLVVLFPYRFWIESTILLAVVTVTEAAGIWWVGRYLHRRLSARDEGVAASE